MVQTKIGPRETPFTVMILLYETIEKKVEVAQK